MEPFDRTRRQSPRRSRQSPRPRNRHELRRDADDHKREGRRTRSGQSRVYPDQPLLPDSFQTGNRHQKRR